MKERSLRIIYTINRVSRVIEIASFTAYDSFVLLGKSLNDWCWDKDVLIFFLHPLASHLVLRREEDVDKTLEILSNKSRIKLETVVIYSRNFFFFTWPTTIIMACISCVYLLSIAIFICSEASHKNNYFSFPSPIELVESEYLRYLYIFPFYPLPAREHLVLTSIKDVVHLQR